VTERDVQGALERAKEPLFGRGKRLNLMGQMIVAAQEDRAILAAEVERLTRLHAARPPYHVASFSPVELDELLARDVAILQAREDVT
jgi:hypothetical protein